MLVQKFGGGILANKTDFQRVADIVKKTHGDIVVVSAVQGVTDELISMLEKAKKGEAFSKQLKTLLKKHVEINGREDREITNVFAEIEKLLIGISYTGECSEKLYATIVSRGEYLSALLLCSYLQEYLFWPAEKGIAAKGSYTNARCDFAKTKKPLVKSIVTGFYGVNEKSEVCLFGRGGSDYTASAIARIVNADKVQFWKNVDGFMTADPKIVNAKLIEQLSFEEAAELSRFGAKILHPSCLEPLLGTSVKVEVKNVLKPETRGTLISKKSNASEISAVTGRKGIAVISVSGNEMVEAFGIASRILTRVANANISVDAIATAQANISFTVDEKQAVQAVESLKNLEQFEVKSKKELALVGIVGNGLKGNPATISRVFSSLSQSNVNIEMISQGASEIDLSIIVKQRDYEKAVQAIHDKFFGEIN